MQKNATQASGEHREISISQFFEKNRHLLGYDNKIKALLTIVKEGVDNALDATEEARILPDIYVKIEELEKEKYRIVIKDNGPGIVKKQVPKIFGKLLYGSKFHRLKQSLTWDEPIIIKRNGKMEILPIGEFVDAYLSKNSEIKDVSDLNIMVPAFDKNEKTYKFRKISHVIRHKRANEVIKVTTAGNKEIKVTGCHSLFKMGHEGKIKEVEARQLRPGDYIISPSRLPSAGDIKEINILDYIDIKDAKNKSIFVYGIDNKIFDEIINSSEIIHKKTDKSRKYYRIRTKSGIIDILDDSIKQYLSKKFLPLHLVIKLGLQNEVKDCTIQTYYHGKPTKTPVIWELTPSLMRFLGLFIAEGHVDNRQIVFTFGKHEDYLVDDICKTARTLGSNFTVEQRARSIRVKVFGNILPILMEKWVKKGANKRIPEFAFRTTESLRQHILDGLYMGDGHLVRDRNCLTYNTASKSLANDIMYLWLMQGILSFSTTRTSRGLGRIPSKIYAVTIYGDDINKSCEFNASKKTLSKRAANSGRGALYLVKSDLCQLKVKSVEIMNDGYEYVYDLSVPKHENFVGGYGGLSCHNSRGQQGIGISGCALYSQLTTGEPTEIITSTGDGKTHRYVLKIDVKANEPKIISSDVINNSDEDKWHGVQVTFVAEGVYREHKQSVLEYLKEVAISNPYSQIIFDSPNGRVEFARGVDQLPPESKEIKPHLYGVEVGMLSRMLHETKARTILTFLTSEFSRVGRLTATQILKEAKIFKLDENGNPTDKPDIQRSPKKLNDDEIRAIIKAIKETKLSRPPTDCLSPLGKELIESGLRKELNPEFVTAISRSPEVYRGWPFQIEVGIAYGGSITEPTVMRFANRVPLLYQSGDCAITKAFNGVDWRRYGLDGGKTLEAPVVVFVHMASVWVPFTSESKESIANYPIIIKEIKLALQDCARKLSIYLSGVRKAEWAAERKRTFEKYLGETALAIEELTGAPRRTVEENLIKIIGKSQQRFEQKMKEQGGEQNDGNKEV